MTRIIRLFMVYLVLVWTFLPYAAAQRLGFVYNHGVQGNPQALTDLDNFLTSRFSSSKVAPPKSWQYVNNQWQYLLFPSPWADQYTTTNSLRSQQAHQLANNINNLVSTNAADRYILVAHSQGTLRAREYIQQSIYRDQTTLNASQKVSGLVVLGSPGQGAPIANNASGFIARIVFDATMVSTVSWLIPGDVWLFFSGFVAGGGALGAALAPVLFAGNSLDELRPQSAFIYRLNNLSLGQSCYWVAQWVGPPYDGYEVWVQVCNTMINPWNPEFHPIPNQVPVLSVVGTDNNADHFLSVAGLMNQESRERWARTADVAQITLWGLAIPTAGLTIPAAIGASDFAGLLWRFQDEWSAIVGQSQHDGFIPDNSQDTTRLPSSVVACGNHNVRRNVAVTHNEEFSQSLAAAYIQEMGNPDRTNNFSTCPTYRVQ